jgi:hypothetical protein
MMDKQAHCPHAHSDNSNRSSRRFIIRLKAPTRLHDEALLYRAEREPIRGGFNDTRAQVYDKFFFPHERPANYLDMETLTKTRLFKRVEGIAGSSLSRRRGRRSSSLTNTALQVLCEAGFSLAAYADGPEQSSDELCWLRNWEISKRPNGSSAS